LGTAISPTPHLERSLEIPSVR